MAEAERDKTTIVRVACPDAPGIIHRVTGVLACEGINVVEQEEFVDATSRRFFLRTACTDADDPGALEARVREVVDDGSGQARVLVRALEPRRIAVLVTREEHCLGDLLLRHYAGELQAEIACVLSNSERLRDLVERFGLPFVYVPHRELEHVEHDARVLEALEPLGVELLVFAKYMRIVGAEFIRRWRERIINIHHSFLPAFVGARPYHQAYERGVKIIGASAHFVTANLDAGPIIEQDVVSVRHSHGVRDLMRSGRNVEKVVLARALRLVLEDRVFVHGNRTVVFD